MHNNTAEDIAKYYGINTRVVTEWALHGYPVRKGGEIIHVKLEGAQKLGTRLWRFNLKTVINFIENLGNETWVSRNVHTPQRTVSKKSPRIGHTNISLMENDFTAALMARVSEQKAKQKMNANA